VGQIWKTGSKQDGFLVAVIWATIPAVSLGAPSIVIVALKQVAVELGRYRDPLGGPPRLPHSALVSAVS